MSFIFFYVFLATLAIKTFICAQQTPYNEALSLLKAMVEKQKENSKNVDNMDKIIKNIKSTSDFQIKFFKIANLNEVLNEMQLPSNIINEIQSIIVFPVMNQFKEFNFKIESPIALLEQYSGVLGAFGEDALIILTNSITSGELVAVYETITAQSCYSVLCFDHCYDYSYEQPRNYTLEEIYLVNKILQDKSYEELARKLDALPQDSNNLVNYTSQNIEENYLSLRNSMKTFPSDIFIPMSIKRNLEKKIIKSSPNIISFEPNVIVHQILGLKNKYFELFAHNLFYLIGLPKNYKKYFSNVFERCPQVKDKSLKLISVIYSTNNDTKCKYFSILMKHNWNLETTDILIANLQQDFVLAPRTIIFAEKTSDSNGDFDFSKLKIKIHKKLSFVENSKVLNILEYLELISLKSLAKFFNSKIENEQNENSLGLLTIGGSTGFLDILQNLENIVKKFKEIISVFKFSSKSVFSKIIEQKGYSYFAARGTFHKGIGLPKVKLPDFTQYILKWLKVSNIEANEQLKSKIIIFI